MHRLFEKADGLTGEIIGAAIEVQRDKGPGLVESIYEWCFVKELEWRGTIQKARWLIVRALLVGALSAHLGVGKQRPYLRLSKSLYRYDAVDWVVAPEESRETAHSRAGATPPRRDPTFARGFRLFRSASQPVLSRLRCSERSVSYDGHVGGQAARAHHSVLLALILDFGLTASVRPRLIDGVSRLMLPGANL